MMCIKKKKVVSPFIIRNFTNLNKCWSQAIRISESLLYIICHLELNNFLKTLDQRADLCERSTKRYSADRKRRCEGLDADTIPPSNIPKWALDKNWNVQGTL